MPQLPILIEILSIFALVVIAGSRKLHLGAMALIGGWAFAFWRGLTIRQTADLTVRELLSADTLLLLALVMGIMVLSTAMKKAGAMDDFARAVGAVTRSRNASMILASTLIGTLPMPGGAALSAPLVGALDPEGKLGPDRLAAANYWFRHAMELWWPLFPAFILTSTLTGFSVLHLSLLNLYSLPVFMILGRVFILGGPGKRMAPAEAPERGPEPRRRAALVGFLPLVIILGTYAVLDPAWRASGVGGRLDGRLAAALGRYLPILCGIGAGCLYIRLRGGKGVFRGTVGAATFSLGGIVAGIRVFAVLLKAGGATTAAAAELSSAGIPPLAVAAVLPFVSGLVTGVGFGYVGLSIPIIVGLYNGGAFGSMALEPVIALAGACGFTGMMVSPLHVCMVVSAQHFGVDLSAVMRRMVAPLSVFVLAAAIYVAILA